jgi:hypothetical protein
MRNSKHANLEDKLKGVIDLPKLGIKLGGRLFDTVAASRRRMALETIAQSFLFISSREDMQQRAFCSSERTEFVASVITYTILLISLFFSRFRRRRRTMS